MGLLLRGGAKGRRGKRKDEKRGRGGITIGFSLPEANFLVTSGYR